jgi:hypothetical protein
MSAFIVAARCSYLAGGTGLPNLLLEIVIIIKSFSFELPGSDSNKGGLVFHRGEGRL